MNDTLHCERCLFPAIWCPEHRAPLTEAGSAGCYDCAWGASGPHSDAAASGHMADTDHLCYIHTGGTQ